MTLSKQTVHLDYDVLFECDSQEYQILEKAVTLIKGIKGAVVEIGTRRGGSTRLIIDALAANQDLGRPLFSIDPYGNIPCEVTNKAITIHHPKQAKELIKDNPDSVEETIQARFDFSNAMRNHTVPWLYYYAYQHEIDFQFFNLEDHEFFKRYADGVPIYNVDKALCDMYALVFFDGPHTNPIVQEEIDFFIPRTSIGSVFVFDDIWMYDHDHIEKQLFTNGWEMIDKQVIKASYKKVSETK